MKYRFFMWEDSVSNLIPVEWFGTLIQLTYTSLAVQINKSKSIYYDHSAKTKNHRICRAKLHILSRYMHSVKLVVINIRERKMPIYLKDL